VPKEVSNKSDAKTIKWAVKSVQAASSITRRAGSWIVRKLTKLKRHQPSIL